METKLTNEVELIKRYNPMAAKIYLDRKYYFLTYCEIADLRKLPASDVKSLYYEAKHLVRDQADLWLRGLSDRAKKALKRNGLINRDKLVYEVTNEVIDLESYKSIGHKLAVEIRRWCLNQ